MSFPHVLLVTAVPLPRSLPVTSFPGAHPHPFLCFTSDCGQLGQLRGVWPLSLHVRAEGVDAPSDLQSPPPHVPEPEVLTLEKDPEGGSGRGSSLFSGPTRLCLPGSVVLPQVLKMWTEIRAAAKQTLSQPYVG